LGKAGKALKFIVDKVNPFEYAKDFIMPKLQANVFEDTIKRQSYLIAENLYQLLKQPYEEQAIEPLKEKIREKLEMLENIRLEKEQGVKDFIKEREQIEKDIKTLEKVI